MNIGVHVSFQISVFVFVFGSIPGVELMQPLWKMEVSQKTKNRTTIWSNLDLKSTLTAVLKQKHTLKGKQKDRIRENIRRLLQ